MAESVPLVVVCRVDLNIVNQQRCRATPDPKAIMAKVDRLASRRQEPKPQRAVPRHLMCPCVGLGIDPQQLRLQDQGLTGDIVLQAQDQPDAHVNGARQNPTLNHKNIGAQAFGHLTVAGIRRDGRAFWRNGTVAPRLKPEQGDIQLDQIGANR